VTGGSRRRLERRAGASNFQRRQAVKRIAVGLALVGAAVLVLYLLFLFGWVR